MSLKSIIASVSRGKVLMPVIQDFIAARQRKLRKGAITRRGETLRGAKQTIRAMKRRIEEFNHGEEIEGEYFHPSALGTCLRMMWLAHFKAPIDIRPPDDELKTYLIFETGSWFHVMMQNLFARAGILEASEIPIKDDKLRILGHADAIVRLDTRYLVELKTINSRQFTLLGNQPKQAHNQQLHAYMKALKLKWGIILYYDKDRSALKEFVIPFDEDFYKEFCEARISRYFKHVRKKTPPDREGTGPTQPPCSWCNFATTCYSSTRMKKLVRAL
jgi:hypothetical protein